MCSTDNRIVLESSIGAEQRQREQYKIQAYQILADRGWEGQKIGQVLLLTKPNRTTAIASTMMQSTAGAPLPSEYLGLCVCVCVSTQVNWRVQA